MKRFLPQPKNMLIRGFGWLDTLNTATVATSISVEALTDTDSKLLAFLIQMAKAK